MMINRPASYTSIIKDKILEYVRFYHNFEIMINEEEDPDWTD